MRAGQSRRSLMKYCAPQYGHLASPVSAIGRYTFGCEFHRYMPGIGQDSGMSSTPTSYLCWALAGIRSCSTVPDRAVGRAISRAIGCLTCAAIPDVRDYNNVDDAGCAISRAQIAQTSSRSAWNSSLLTIGGWPSRTSLCSRRR